MEISGSNDFFMNDFLVPGEQIVSEKNIRGPSFWCVIHKQPFQKKVDKPGEFPIGRISGFS